MTRRRELQAARRIQLASPIPPHVQLWFTEGWFPEVGSIVWYASLLFCNARGKIGGISGSCKGDLRDGVSALTAETGRSEIDENLTKYRGISMHFFELWG